MARSSGHDANHQAGTQVNVELWAINHKKPDPDPLPNFGGIHREFVVGVDDDHELDPRYCDMAAPFHIWGEPSLPDIIGFHGYRKMLNFRNSMGLILPRSKLAPGWEEVTIDQFNQYKDWLREWDSTPLRWQLRMMNWDLLTVEPFNCGYNGNIGNDYAVSRSADDWRALEGVLRNHGVHNFNTHLIRPMHFVCQTHIFCRWMRFWNTVRQELEPLIQSADAKAPAYPPRALAMLSERIWSLWVQHSNLRVKTLPLMICWEAH